MAIGVAATVSSPLSERAKGIEVFSAVPIFKGFGEEELKAIVNLSKKQSFKPGETIVREGEAGLGFYVIVEGRASVKKKGRIVAKLGRGGFFGEMALFDDMPRSADVVADEPTECLVLLRWNFWSLVTKNKKMVQELFREMARRLRATDEALKE